MAFEMRLSQACPSRSGYNTALFADVVSDQCLDGACYETKINAHIDRELAARPELVQIENGYRSPKEKRPDAVLVLPPPKVFATAPPP